MKVLFINASPHVNGHSVRLAKVLIGRKPNVTVNLVTQNVKQIGQLGNSNDDFAKICRFVRKANVIVMATPVYCLDMSGYLKTFIDRMSEILVNHQSNPFYHKRIDLVVSYEVNPEAVKHIDTVVETECHDMKIHYGGVVSTLAEAKKAHL